MKAFTYCKPFKIAAGIFFVIVPVCDRQTRLLHRVIDDTFLKIKGVTNKKPTVSAN